MSGGKVHPWCTDPVPCPEVKHRAKPYDLCNCQVSALIRSNEMSLLIRLPWGLPLGPEDHPAPIPLPRGPPLGPEDHPEPIYLQWGLPLAPWGSPITYLPPVRSPSGAQKITFHLSASREVSLWVPEDHPEPICLPWGLPLGLWGSPITYLPPVRSPLGSRDHRHLSNSREVSLWVPEDHLPPINGEHPSLLQSFPVEHTLNPWPNHSATPVKLL